MKKFIFAFIFTFCSCAFAQYEAGKGFRYNQPTKKNNVEVDETPNASQVKILRFYNESSKVSDPLSKETNKSDEANIKFFKITDKTLKKPKQSEDQRSIASTPGLEMDLETIESELMAIEKELGIKSMPVLKFAKDNIDTDGYIQRVHYIEYRLGIYKEAKDSGLVLSERIHNIKSKMAEK